MVNSRSTASSLFFQPVRFVRIGNIHMHFSPLAALISCGLWLAPFLTYKMFPGDCHMIRFLLYPPVMLRVSIYRVIQEERSILWKVIVSAIVSKRVHMNMYKILNGYRYIDVEIKNSKSFTLAF
jgi:hypothetical protein